MKVIHIFSSSLGYFHDSQQIRISNYINREVMSNSNIQIKLYGMGSGCLNDYGIIDLTDGEYKNYVVENKLLLNVYSRFLYPDMFRNFRFLVRDAILNEINEGDVVVTSSGSVEAHLGAFLAKRLKSFHWIADYGDPLAYVEKEMRPWFYYHAYRDEKKVLQNADSVIVTTQETKSLLEKSHKCTNIELLPYGHRVKSFNAKAKKNSSSLRMGHLGVAYKANRDLRPLILTFKKHAFEDLNISFYLAGPRSNEFDLVAREIEKSQNNFELLSNAKVEFKESLKILSDMDIMPIVGNKSPVQIPGKCYILLAIPNPILYIKQCENDPFLTLFQGDKSILVCDNSEESIAKALTDYVNNRVYYEEMSTLRAQSKLVRSFSDTKLTEKFLNII